jgi:shikimate dehydrogenase
MTEFWEWREAPPGHFAVLGDPIAHSKSPAMHAAAYRARGLRLDYRAVRVPLDELAPALARLRDLGYRGVNCTVPLKEAAAEWAKGRGGWEEDDGLAPRVGANTLDLRTSRAASTDEAGFMASLPPDLKPGKALILGAGGSGKALALALRDAGWSLRLWNRTPGRWEDWSQLPAQAEVVSAAESAGCTLVVNATSAGLAGLAPPVKWSGSGHAVELAYGRVSPFLAQAEGAGWTGQDGRAMLVEQGALAFEWWLRIPAPRKDMLQAVL